VRSLFVSSSVDPDIPEDAADGGADAGTNGGTSVDCDSGGAFVATRFETPLFTNASMMLDDQMRPASPVFLSFFLSFFLSSTQNI
jgi:hypothetical protein